MKLPTTLNINGYIYKIKYTDDMRTVSDDGEKCFGYIDSYNKEITVYKDGHEMQTILHEVFHALSEILHLKCFDGKKGHKELDILSSAVMDFLIRNNIVKL